ncbi:MAG: hypothetical protein PHU53_06925 [Thermoplasmata archaeon]|nr:hypothetical protein [Thermoplasmata archaeon]
MNLDILCLDSISVSDPILRGNSVSSRITLTHPGGNRAEFELKIRYESKADERHLPLYRMAMAMPVMNYGLFANSVDLEFPISGADKKLLCDLLDIFSRDIFVNKLVRRRTQHLIEKYLPKGEEINPENAKPRAEVRTRGSAKDSALSKKPEPGKCGILSSGGKEALTTYSMLKELGADVHPIYVNESGGHWRTALTAYRWHSETEPNTCRVWTNVDRFYLFMLDNLKIVKKNHRNIPGDTYPIRLCIFPVYLFQLLPVFLDRGIGNLLIGSEFDDPRGEWTYSGIKHYFGIYDQHQDFDLRMEEWYAERIPGMRQWSALRPISGLIVERILTKRYPEASKYQRSCHSCHFDKEKIVPCGKCTKCLGVMLFLKANLADPRIMGYRKADVGAFPERLAATKLRLDPDELEQSKFLAGLDGDKRAHAEGIHIYPATSNPELIPERYREGVLHILGSHAKGNWKLADGEWTLTESI